jgi:hypothetical protein
LKKPRSLSEGESSSNSEHKRKGLNVESSTESSINNMSSSGNSSGESLNDQKKSVKFNKDIKRTLFKSGSAVAGMSSEICFFPNI